MPARRHEVLGTGMLRFTGHVLGSALALLVMSAASTSAGEPVDRVSTFGEIGHRPVPGPIEPGFKGEAYVVPAHPDAGKDPNAVSVTLRNEDGDVVGTDDVRAGQARRVEALDGDSDLVAIDWRDGVTAFAERENFWSMPNFIKLKDMTLNIDGRTTSLGGSGLVYHLGVPGWFDVRGTPAHDGIAPRSQRFLACEVDTWSMGQQTFTVDLIELGLHRRDRSLIDKGVIGLDWGTAVPIDDSGVHHLHQECDGKTVPDHGGTHHTTQWLESMGRAVYLLAASEYAGELRSKIDAYIDRIELIAERLVRPDNWDQWERAIQDDNGHDFTHRTFMMAAGLGLASTLTDDDNDAEMWAETAARIAQRGIGHQREDGVNPERGGYDVQYQMYGVWLAEIYYATLSPDNDLRAELGESIDRAIDWMVEHIDKRTGQIIIGDSTRICAERNWWTGKTAESHNAAETIRAFLLWGHVRSDSVLVEDAILLDRGAKQFGNACPTDKAAPSSTGGGARPPNGSGGERSFETPIGDLSNRRVVAAAAAALICFLLLSWSPLSRRPAKSRLAVRVAAPVVVFVVAAFVLAA
jgi:hypothetical protein